MRFKKYIFILIAVPILGGSYTPAKAQDAESVKKITQELSRTKYYGHSMVITTDNYIPADSLKFKVDYKSAPFYNNRQFMVRIIEFEKQIS